MTNLDEDVDYMDAKELRGEVKKLRAGIRQHRDASGHNLCWYVPELWNLLPEKVEPKPEVPPVGEFLQCCRVYRASLSDPKILKCLEPECTSDSVFPSNYCKIHKPY